MHLAIQVLLKNIVYKVSFLNNLSSLYLARFPPTCKFVGGNMSDYHYGLTIKKYREMRNISQQELAEKWPRSDGGLGVSWQYVQLVEYGKRKITDVYVLRKLCDMLEVPLFEFGLSDYDPFNTSLVPGGGVKLYNETLDLAEALIHQTFAMRRYAPVPEE